MFTGCANNPLNKNSEYNINDMVNDWHTQLRNAPINPFEGYCLGTSLADISNAPADSKEIDKIALETKTKSVKKTTHNSLELSKNWHKKYRNAPKNPFEGYCLYTPPTDEEYMELEKKSKRKRSNNYKNTEEYPLYMDDRG